MLLILMHDNYGIIIYADLMLYHIIHSLNVFYEYGELSLNNFTILTHICQMWAVNCLID